MQNLSKETVEGSIVKAGHLKNLGSDRINCYNLVIDKRVRIELQRLIRFTVVNGRCGLPCKDHDSSCDSGRVLERFKLCKEKNTTFFNASSIYLKV